MLRFECGAVAETGHQYYAGLGGSVADFVQNVAPVQPRHGEVEQSQNEAFAAGAEQLKGGRAVAAGNNAEPPMLEKTPGEFSNVGFIVNNEYGTASPPFGRLVFGGRAFGRCSKHGK